MAIFSRLKKSTVPILHRINFLHEATLRNVAHSRSGLILFWSLFAPLIFFLLIKFLSCKELELSLQKISCFRTIKLFVLVCLNTNSSTLTFYLIHEEGSAIENRKPISFP